MNMHEAIASVGPEEPLPQRATVSFWVTRDSEIGGGLSDVVDVWLVKPERGALSSDGGVCWWADGGVYRQVNTGVCWAWCGTYPSDDRQCVLVERYLPPTEGVA